MYDCGFETPNAGHFRLDNVHLEYDVVRKIPEATPCLADCVVTMPLEMVPPGRKRLEGELYYFWHVRTGGDPDVLRQVGRIVELAHAAGLFDVDLHSMNVMIVKGPDGCPWPKLFDFNLIPFHEHPPNPLVAVLLRLGLMNVRERDLRKLRNFHDFRRVERKLLRFYD